MNIYEAIGKLAEVQLHALSQGHSDMPYHKFDRFANICVEVHDWAIKMNESEAVKP